MNGGGGGEGGGGQGRHTLAFRVQSPIGAQAGVAYG